MISCGEYETLLRDNGVNLNETMYVDDIALSLNDARIALDHLRKCKVAIIGGDVYYRTATGIKSAHGNWYVQPQSGEGRMEFLNRSWSVTLEYISLFPVIRDSENLFSFVLGEVLPG
jgi:hypothetical protein